MRILQIAPLWESVPPAGYGGTEAVVHLLVEELVRRGHQVTLFASGDSRTSARLQATYPQSLRTAHRLGDKTPYFWEHCARAIAAAPNYDVIHNHSGEEVMALARLAHGVPMLTTMHCNLTDDRKFIWDGYEGYFNTVSWSQRRAMPHVERPIFAGVAYNAIDVASFPFDGDKDGYLLFLSRVSLEKGTHIAIEAARRSGERLLIAGKVDAADYAYYSSMVAPQIDGEQIVFLGEAGPRRKRELYRKAKAVLMPIVWEEPFGLVMAEAQACGTPVIAFRRGAVPEVVRHGETGFVVDDVAQMAEAVSRLREIDPAACRRWVAERFDASLMADRYLELFGRVLDTGARPAPPLPALESEPAVQAEHVA